LNFTTQAVKAERKCTTSKI